jgi:hypothetical protein
MRLLGAHLASLPTHTALREIFKRLLKLKIRCIVGWCVAPSGRKTPFFLKKKMTERTTAVAADEILERYCEEILQDQPKIDEALKNLLSWNISAYQTADQTRTLDPNHMKGIMTTVR